MNVPPGEDVEGLPDDTNAWECYFVTDLVHLQNASAARIIDVGWYPGRRASGAFRVRLLTALRTSRGLIADWDNPIVDYETRNLAKVLEKISALATAPTR
jgi:hypothetical protein